MDKLIKRLREGAIFYNAPSTWNEAADRIEKLELENDKLRLDARDKDGERERFEAYLRSFGIRIFGLGKDGEYLEKNTELHWQTWNASKDLRERRDRALRSCPAWMLSDAAYNDWLAAQKGKEGGV